MNTEEHHITLWYQLHEPKFIFLMDQCYYADSLHEVRGRYNQPSIFIKSGSFMDNVAPACRCLRGAPNNVSGHGYKNKNLSIKHRTLIRVTDSVRPINVQVPPSYLCLLRPLFIGLKYLIYWHAGGSRQIVTSFISQEVNGLIILIEYFIWLRIEIVKYTQILPGYKSSNQHGVKKRPKTTVENSIYLPNRESQWEIICKMNPLEVSSSHTSYNPHDNKCGYAKDYKVNNSYVVGWF